MLAISSSGSVSSLWLAPRLAAFAALHPSVQWQVRSIEDNEPGHGARGPGPGIAPRPRRGVLADGDRLLFSETVFPVCSPSLRRRGQRRGTVRHTLLQEDSRCRQARKKTGPPGSNCSASRPNAKATIVRFYTFSAAVAAAVAGAGIALGRTPLIDPDSSSGRLVRPFADASLPGSWDFVIRRRPGAARDVHVDQSAALPAWRSRAHLTSPRRLADHPPRICGAEHAGTQAGVSSAPCWSRRPLQPTPRARCVSACRTIRMRWIRRAAARSQGASCSPACATSWSTSAPI